MSALGITFVAFVLSWLVGRIASEIDGALADVIHIICVMIFFVAMMTGFLVLVGMML